MIRFNRRTVECQKIALKSLLEMSEQNSEYVQRAIARLRARIKAREKILRGNGDM